MTWWAKRWVQAAALALGGAVLTGTAGAQQVGSVTGRITDAGTGQPVPVSQVQVVGTNLGAMANEQGRYTIRGVPARAVSIRVLRVGYQEQSLTVTVPAGGEATADFAIRQASVNLTPVVTTATGETRRVEIGNAVSTIDASKVAEASPISNLADMLNSRAPGVSVLSGTQTGTGQRVRIRGTNSLSLSNEPIYVIDGVRMTSNAASGFSTGGNRPSRVTDLNPEEIENIEIVKGPSAATLYGTDAANGVIVITTKKGRAGRPQWSVYAEGGAIKDLHDYTTNYTIAGHSPGATAYRECALPLISAGTCIKDSVRVYSPINDPDATPLGLGHRSQFGLQLSGGNEAVRYFLSGEREDETGVLQLPDFERRRFTESNTPIHDYVDRPNVLGKNSYRANLNAAINPKLDAAVSIGFINSDARFQLESNATAGLGSHLFGGKGYKDNGSVPSVGTPLNGYRQWTPGYTWQEKTGQGVNRFIGSLNVQYRPSSWLAARATVGNDLTGRVDDDLLLRGEGPPISATYRNGFKFNQRTNIRNFTTDASATATFNPLSWLNSRTTVGTQYVAYQLDQSQAGGEDLPPGTQTAGQGAIPSSSEGTTIQKTLGLYVEEATAFRDRLFLTAAVRTDQNSAFGTNFQSVFYPKLSASWLVSEESFFPELGWLDNLRLRGAFGASGVQPGPNDALRTFAGTTPSVRSVDAPGVVFDDVGNTDLKPERTTEFETGFEARFFNSRATLDLTYYYKRTKDALVSAQVAPSLGAAMTVRRNLGAVRNYGLEMLLTGQLVDRRSVGFDISLNGSLNDNKLLDLGGVLLAPGTSTRNVVDYPIAGLWARPITGWEDKNGDGILTYNADASKNEVFVGDSAIFRGYNTPRYMLTVTPGLDLFGRALRFQALFDYRGGNKYYNNTERIRCVSRQNCNGLMNPEASFEEQAMVVATRDHPSATLDGFFQSGAFVKLRELSATYRVPDAFTRRFGRFRALSLTGTARNVALWTHYRGSDPETDRNASEDSNSAEDFQTIAPPSYFVLRLNVGF